MNLTGRGILCVVKDAGQKMLIASAPKGELLVLGKIEGETPNIGLWVSVHWWCEPGGSEHRAPNVDSLFLFQWDAIRSAEIVPDGTDPKVLGFRHLVQGSSA